MIQYFELESKTYFGGKASNGVPQTLINQVPPHQSKTIGFGGQCALTRYMMPAQENILYELNSEVVQLWKNANLVSSHNISILEQCFLSSFNPDNYTETDFIYLDPPYPHDTRKSKNRYKFEMTDKQHQSMLAKCCDASGMIAISSYQNKMYDEMLKGWRTIEFESMTRSGKKATEILYMNYDEPTELHDYTYIGEDFREREAIKRRHVNFLRKIDRLDVLERNKLLEEIKIRYLSEGSQKIAV